MDGKEHPQEKVRINEEYRRLFPRNCPIIEVDGDGKEVGTCTYYKPKGVCPIHGRLPSSQRERKKSALNLYEIARQTVINRANGYCEKCGALGTDPHHIFGRVGENLWNANKIIFLCHACHDEAHADLGESRVYLMNILTQEHA